jgi:WD40 repeat protein
MSVAYSPNGKYVASGSLDKSIRIWSVSESKEILIL